MSRRDPAKDQALRWLAIVLGLALVLSLVIPFAVSARADGWSDASSWLIADSGLLAGVIGCSLLGVVGWLVSRRRKPLNGD